MFKVQSQPPFSIILFIKDLRSPHLQQSTALSYSLKLFLVLNEAQVTIKQQVLEYFQTFLAVAR